MHFGMPGEQDFIIGIQCRKFLLDRHQGRLVDRIREIDAQQDQHLIGRLK